ncbi:hypothetical protein G6011_08126 [Alternaria panax]|uniref:Uncharacterized protein n=1 Tax=Alternaria panax TaxID=48097 RepID=A0AAD4FJD7_9PLEO|nr:hypothetical protein G6011_08126 [Alternaria panax]
MTLKVDSADYQLHRRHDPAIPANEPNHRHISHPVDREGEQRLNELTHPKFCDHGRHPNYPIYQPCDLDGIEGPQPSSFLPPGHSHNRFQPGTFLLAIRGRFKALAVSTWIAILGSLRTHRSAANKNHKQRNKPGEQSNKKEKKRTKKVAAADEEDEQP